MCSLRSFLATTSSTLSSTPLRPSFHDSSTRTAYCSTVSGCVLNTISTATCAPLRRSNSASVCSSAERCCALSVPVRSVTRAFSGGTAICAAATATRKRLLSEINLRRSRDFFLVLHRELRLFLEAEHHRREVAGERAHRDVVLLHCPDVAVARHRDAVLGALELRLQLKEVLVRLELRIVLGDHQQARQRAGELALRLREALEGLRVVHQLRGGLDRADLGARVGDAEQHLLLLGGESLHRGDQVRHQVGAPLVLVEHLGPACLDLLVGLLEGVVAAAAEQQRCKKKNESRQATGS